MCALSNVHSGELMHLPWRDVALGGQSDISTSITNNETEVLSRLASGAAALEIGAAYGYSAVIMAKAGAFVTSVDPHQWLASYDSMLANVVAHGVSDRVTMVRQSSKEALPDLMGQGHRFDLVFVDGDHGAQAVEHDVTWALALLAPDGVIAIHDYLEMCCCPDVRMVCDRIFGPADPADVIDTLRLVHP